MRACLLDLDGSVAGQPGLCDVLSADVADVRDWGPWLRLGCSWRRFRAFEQALAMPTPRDGMLTLLGSTDFHHVTLALLRRIDEPFNLAVIDAELDWSSGFGGLNHRNWLRHVPANTQARRIFHVGASRWSKPDAALRRRVADQTVTVLPLVSYAAASAIASGQPLRQNGYQRCCRERFRECLEPHRAELRRRPLYVSIDKSALVARDAEVNGESGCLWNRELVDIVGCLREACAGQFLAVDIVGDWSPRIIRGVWGRALAMLEPAERHVDPHHAAQLNAQTNRLLIEQFLGTHAAPALAA